jgi:Protein of unknown function (DUF2917)
MMPLNDGHGKEPQVSQSSMHRLQHLHARETAWISAVHQPLWITRDGDPADHVLAPGERLAVARGDRLAVGAWHPDGGVTWAWQPLGRPARRGAWRRGMAAALGLAAGALCAAAQALRHSADTLAGLARRADAA